MNIPELDLIILKTLITNKKHAVDFVNECETKLFSPEVWNVANIITGYIKTYKETPTLRVIIDKLSAGKNDRLIEHVKDVWSKLESVQADSREYKHELSKIKKRFAQQQIVSVNETLNKVNDGTVDISCAVKDMQRAIQSIKGLDGLKTYNNKDIKEYLPAFVDKFNAKRNDPDYEIGLKTYYSFLDYSTNGLKEADFVLIAGESGFGKSLFLQNMAIQTWMQSDKVDFDSTFKNGKNILYFSLEMPYEDCFNRLIGRLSGIKIKKIENAKLNKEEFVKVKRALDFINKNPFKFQIVDISDVCANDLENILNNCEIKPDAIFIDYLGIMNTNERSNDADWLLQGRVSYEVRAIARAHNLPIFSAVQLNRKAPSKESSENIGLSRLARSGTIATHATHVIQIENRLNEEAYPDFIYHLIKSRKGPKGKGVLLKDLSCATLLDQNMDNEDVGYDFIDVDDISVHLENLDINNLCVC